ncbi:hypothetical protein BCIN_10g01600 [Botrytis cinerea B05.10]|uniref:Hydantoinase/oxoprolinase n=1 Tax=Botryotinia fuckeliana (strain B05.10) TaxID=332648 RepID=A0A384JUE1_BOTFB|nr:hypothetical protein BCIN_10g01600 [Botrytis cinerea B05.10]ATZ54140.1 hypothetical protein BCIN_10g01600 [Botrytis cinerea B05.10]
MPSRISSRVIGIDVGGTNTDAVILQNDNVLAWHKTPTTPDIQDGVEQAIAAVIKNAQISKDSIDFIKIGTTQFVNAVLEQNATKLDKVAVIRLCGPYSRGSPPFVGFPESLRKLMEGHYGYVDGGLQVDGTPISEVNVQQLREQASIIRSKSISSVVVIGIYSPSNPAQEEFARQILAEELGSEYDISCSYTIGRIGFLERENASILNASLRRFARHVIAGFAHAVHDLKNASLYITLNDGTLSKASIAAEHPVRCFSSGPTNSARGAALLAKNECMDLEGDNEVLVVDVGGTTTDICALLKSGYPRQSAAFVKIAGVRTNFTIPDVYSIALGGGSLIRTTSTGKTTVGPDSVGPKLEMESIAFGGQTLTATDLVLSNERTDIIPDELRIGGHSEIQRALEDAIDQVKTKQGYASVILVGGGSIIVGKDIAGVGEVIRPKYLEVANAVGAAIGKISGHVDTVVTPGEKTIEEEIEEAKLLAIRRCIAAGGDEKTIEVVEVDTLPINYVTNGSTQLVVRVVGDLRNTGEKVRDMETMPISMSTFKPRRADSGYSASGLDSPVDTKASTYNILEHVDLESYRPRIEGDIWHLSEIDLKFLMDGTGILGVGSCGEPYPSYIACLIALESGEGLRIRRQDTIPDDALIMSAGFMGSPTVYLERIPGLNEITDTVKALMSATGHTSFDATIPNEIGGMNSFEALLTAHRFGKPTLDSDCVSRAYPMVWQTVRCLNGVPVTPAAVANGCGGTEVFVNSKDAEEAELLMRDACTKQGSLSGMVVNPIRGNEARTLPSNSYSWAWQIGRSIAIARSKKVDPVKDLMRTQNGTLLFSGKIVSVTRKVAEGFTRGSVLLDHITSSTSTTSTSEKITSSLYVEFENENLCAVLKTPGEEDQVLAVCPDLIVVLDMANGAPLGISDYKYGLRVSVIALKAPEVWTTEEGLKMGGPRAFGLDMDYVGVCAESQYEAPKSVWELFGDEVESKC